MSLCRHYYFVLPLCTDKEDIQRSSDANRQRHRHHHHAHRDSASTGARSVADLLVVNRQRIVIRKAVGQTACRQDGDAARVLTIRSECVAAVYWRGRPRHIALLCLCTTSAKMIMMVSIIMSTMMRIKHTLNTMAMKIYRRTVTVLIAHVIDILIRIMMFTLIIKVVLNVVIMCTQHFVERIKLTSSPHSSLLLECMIRISKQFKVIEQAICEKS